MNNNKESMERTDVTRPFAIAQLVYASICLIPALYGLYMLTLVMVDNGSGFSQGYIIYFVALLGFVLYYHTIKLVRRRGSLNYARKVWLCILVYNLMPSGYISALIVIDGMQAVDMSMMLIYLFVWIPVFLSIAALLRIRRYRMAHP